jgi:hypothetical protein
MNKLAEDFMSKFRARIAYPESLLNYVHNLSLEDSLSILKELNAHPENFPEIVHEASSFLTTMLVIKYAGLPVLEKSFWKRILRR